MIDDPDRVRARALFQELQDGGYGIAASLHRAGANPSVPGENPDLRIPPKNHNRAGFHATLIVATRSSASRCTSFLLFGGPGSRMGMKMTDVFGPQGRVALQGVLEQSKGVFALLFYITKTAPKGVGHVAEIAPEWRHSRRMRRRPDGLGEIREPFGYSISPHHELDILKTGFRSRVRHRILGSRCRMNSARIASVRCRFAATPVAARTAGSPKLEASTSITSKASRTRLEAHSKS